MCMTFGCNCHFFRSSDLVIFGLKARRHWVSCERNSPDPFLTLQVFLSSLNMCMTFGCNHPINFCHFFHNSNKVIFGLKALRH